MRICFIAKDLTIGGAAGYGGHKRFAYELITRIAAAVDGGVLILAERASGLPPGIDCRTGIGSVSLFKNYFRFRQAIKDCDVVHALGIWRSGVIGYLLSLGLGKRLVITLEATSAVKHMTRPWRHFLAGLAYRAADRIVAISRFTATEVRRVFPGLEIDIINHGVDLNKFGASHQCQPDVFKRLALDRPYILSVGAIKERKGYHLSVQAFAQAARHFPDLHYFIVGYQYGPSDPYVQSIKRLVGQLGLEEKIHFLEDIEDDYLQELYQHGKLFILLPHNVADDFEGFGLVFLEAAANGLPSVATWGNGSEDAVIDGETGFLVSQNSIAQAAGAIEKLLGDQVLREKISGQARVFARDSSWDRVVTQYLEAYRGPARARSIGAKAYDNPVVVASYRTKGLYPAEEAVFKYYFRPAGKTLDIGCGTGRTTTKLSELGFEVTGVDLSKSMIEEARHLYPALDFQIMDAAQLTFGDDVFDNIIFSFNGLDDIYPRHRRIQALSEVYRVLKPGGIFAFSSHNTHFVPNSPGRLKIWLLNLPRLLSGSPYYRDDGGFLRYRASPSSQLRNLNDIGFQVLKIMAGRSTKNKLLHLREPWLYYVCKK